MGRFITKDPIRDGQNWYIYVRNNPLGFVDPSGLDSESTTIEDPDYSADNPVEVKNLEEPAVNNMLVQNPDKSADNPTLEGVDGRSITIWDDYTIKQIKSLDKSIQDDAKDFILDVQTAGIGIRITEGFRTNEKQDEYFSKGRDENGNIVNENAIRTYAKGGESYHNYGLAFDVVPMKDSRTPDWAGPWETIGLIGERRGFVWGGRWTKPVDKPHFQMTFGKSISDLQKQNQEKKDE